MAVIGQTMPRSVAGGTGGRRCLDGVREADVCGPLMLAVWVLYRHPPVIPEVGPIHPVRERDITMVYGRLPCGIPDGAAGGIIRHVSRLTSKTPLGVIDGNISHTDSVCGRWREMEMGHARRRCRVGSP